MNKQTNMRNNSKINRYLNETQVYNKSFIELYLKYGYVPLRHHNNLLLSVLQNFICVHLLFSYGHI